MKHLKHNQSLSLYFSNLGISTLRPFLFLISRTTF